MCNGPRVVNATKMLVKKFGTKCPLYNDRDYTDFARWLEEDNSCLFTVMVCAYANSMKGKMKHIDEVRE